MHPSLDRRQRATDLHPLVIGVGLRLEARNYLSQFQGLSGEMEDAKTRNDVTILSAVTIGF